MIAIVKYNAGNIRSVQNALNQLGYKNIITDDPEAIRCADKVIFPGVGEASTAMHYLKERRLDTLIRSLTQPTLGICLGQQLLCQHSEEGNTTCIGIFEANVKKLPPQNKVPHMGWNNFFTLKGPLFEGIKPASNVYYVHSYYAEITHQTAAICDYILPFAAAMHKENFYATQFHPEKSADVGARILKNFLIL